MKKKIKSQDKENHMVLLRRLTLSLVIGYLAAVILFYFLAGEQLHLRESRGNYPLPEADSGTVELVSGSVVEQQFFAEIQRSFLSPGAAVSENPQKNILPKQCKIVIIM